MIITLIFITMFILGIIVFTFEHANEIAIFLSLISIIIGFAVSVICLLTIIAVHLTSDNDICNTQIEYESIVKQVEVINSDYEDVSKATVIDKAYTWNKKVHSEQYWGNNPWTNWFWDKDYIESLKYIDLED